TCVWKCAAPTIGTSSGVVPVSRSSMYASAGMAIRLFDPPSLGSIKPGAPALPIGAFVAPGATADDACAGCGGSPPFPHDESTTYAPLLPSRSAANGNSHPLRDPA